MTGRLLSEVHSDKARCNRQKLHCKGRNSNETSRKRLFTREAVKHWNGLSSQVLQSASLEILKMNWRRAVSSLILIDPV